MAWPRTKTTTTETKYAKTLAWHPKKTTKTQIKSAKTMAWHHKKSRKRRWNMQKNKNPPPEFGTCKVRTFPRGNVHSARTFPPGNVHILQLSTINRPLDYICCGHANVHKARAE